MYFFYIDESGNRDVNVDEPYVLAAVGMYEGQWRGFNKHLMGMKTNISREYGANIGQDQLEVKANLLTKPKAREKSDFFRHLSDKDIRHISDHYYQQLKRSKMVVIAVIIRKKDLRAGYTSEEMHEKAYEMLLERIQHYMRQRQKRHKALIIMDDASAKLNRKITFVHSRLLGIGSRHGDRQMEFSNIIEYPFFVSSELSNGVQLADLVAYTVYYTFKHNDPKYAFMERIRPHIARPRDNNNELAGLKIWPNEADEFKQVRQALEDIENGKLDD